MTIDFDELDKNKRELVDAIESLNPEDESLEYIKDNFDAYAREMSRMSDEIESSADVLTATNEFIGDAADEISDLDEAYDFFLYIDEGGDMDSSELKTDILDGVEREGRKTREAVSEEAGYTRDAIRTQHSSTRGTVDESRRKLLYAIGGLGATILAGFGYQEWTDENSNSNERNSDTGDGGVDPVDGPDFRFEERYDGEDFVDCFSDDELDEIEGYFGEDPENIEYVPHDGDGDTIDIKMYSDDDEATYSRESLECEVGY